jgi:hypothetical protein
MCRSSFWLPIAIFLFAPAVVSAQTSAVQSRITAAIDERSLTLLKGNTHPLARPEFDRGAAPGSLPMRRMLLVLKRSPDQEAALNALMDQQQDPSSPNFHKWLTPAQFGQQFGPSDQDIQTITSWLQSHGFQIAKVSNGRTVIEFSGTAGQVQETFHTAIHKFNVNGEDHWANSSDPQIPAALAPVVAGVDTLYNFPRHAMHHLDGVVSRSKASGKLKSASPLFTLGGECGVPGVGCYGLGPYDFATIYNVLPLWTANPATDGTGQTISIVAESDISLQDIRSFRSYFGLPASDPNIILDGPDPGIVMGDETESDLDVEWAGAVAKGAAIDFVISQSTEASLGVDLSAQYIVDNNLAPIISESYGICELFLGSAGIQFYNQLWQQASAQGITALVSTGDSGSAVCDRNAGTPGAAEFGLSVNGFASTPYNVAVGGTDFFDLTNPNTYWSGTNSVPPGSPAGTPATVSALSYIPETTWNDSCTNAVFGNLLGFSPNAETNCNDSELINAGFVTAVGASGGKSSCTTYDGTNPTACTGGYPKPSWQTGTGVPSDGKRDVPDVSMFAASGSPSGAFFLICEADALPPGVTSCDSTDSNTNFLGVGGTSASTPAFAGIMALVDQKTGARQGNANYVLYPLAAKSGASCNSSNGAGANCVFYDVTNGTIAMPCAVTSPNCNISIAGDQVGLLFANNAPAYNAVTGYDLATGLGSVNAANLVSKWQAFAAALKPSATTLTLNSGNAVNIPHGQSVNFTVNVAATPPASGTPSGNVSLVANTAPPSAPTEVTQQGVQEFALANGSVSNSTSALPGGTYTVFAQYPGDGIFGASNSTPPVSVTVSPESSKTFADLVTLDINGNLTGFGASNSTYGAGYSIFRVDVGNASGSVSPSTGVSTSCSKGVSNCPTGTVTLTSTGAPLSVGSLVLNSEGYAEVRPLTPGTYAVTANYSGDASYGASSAAAGFTIAKAPTTATAGVAGSPVIQNDSAEISANVATTSDGVAPTGTFTFLVDGAAVTLPFAVYESGPFSPTAAPPYAWEDVVSSYTFTTGGKHTLAAQYSGDSNYAASTSPAANVTVLWATQTALTSSSPTITQGQSVTFTAQVTGAQPGLPITGTFQFRNANTLLGNPVAISTSGQGTLTTTSLPVGQNLIRVDYSSDANYASSLDEIFQTVTPGPTFAISANPTTVPITAPGQSGATTLTFIASNGFSSNGAVMVTPICSGLPNESGCSSGASVTFPANGTATATLTFTTTAPSSLAPRSRYTPSNFGARTPLTIATLVVLFCLLMLAPAARKRWIHSAIGLVIACGLLIAAGCGGGSGGGGGGGGGGGNPGTLLGQYNVSVAVTINGVTANVPILLNVQ